MRRGADEGWTARGGVPRRGRLARRLTGGSRGFRDAGRYPIMPLSEPADVPTPENAMNEYEAATLAFRTASLWAAYGQIGATLVIGLGQIAVVWYGIRAMQRTGERRAVEQDQRHAEAMQALDVQRQALETLITRTAPAGAA